MRGVCVGIILAASLSLVSVPTAAASSGPCTLLGYESRSGGTPRQIEQRAHQGTGDVQVTDLSSSHWRVDARSKVIVQQVGLGPQPAPQGWLTAFGVLRYPLFKLGQGRRDVWYAGPWDGQQLAPLARRWGLEIQAGSCTGSTVLEFHGHPLLSAAGVGGNLLGVLGLIGLVRVALRHRRYVQRPGDRPAYSAARRLAAAGTGLGLGLLAGLGEGVWMQQAGTISPLDARSLLVPLGGLLLGLAAGTAGGVRMKSKPIRSAPGVAVFELPGCEPLGIIGEGANGTLYLARQVELDRLVAIRRLPADLSNDRTVMRRFRQSAADQSRLRHPNWAEVYALRTHDGHAYLVTEFVEGASLRQVMKAAGRLTPEQALGVMSGVLKGLAHAHDMGLVHGALRPENVIVDTSGTSKLVDLGLPGRPNAYWSPEQRTTLRAERLSDVYAAGVMLHELLTGRLIEAEGVQLAARHVSAELRPPIAALIRRAVDETPARRQPSARAFLHDLERSAEGSYGSDWQSRASIAEAVAVAAATGATAATLISAGAAQAGAVAAAGASATAGALVTGSTTTASVATQTAASGGAGGATTAVGASAAGAPPFGLGALAKFPVQAMAGASAFILVSAGAPVVQVPPAIPTAVITPSQAVEVTLAAWQSAQAAYRAHDINDRGLALFFDGQALQELRTVILDLRTNRGLLQANLAGVQVAVPLQTSFPAQFTSFGATGSKQIALRFVRTAALEGWKAVNLMIVGSGLPGFAINSHGYAEQLSQAKLSQLLVLPERTPRMFIAFLSSSGSAGGFAAGPNTIGVIQADHHLVADAGRRYVASSISYEPADRPVLVYPLVDGGALVAFVIAKHIQHVGGCGCWIAAYPAGDAPLWPGPFTYSGHYEVAGLAVIPSKHASTAGTVAMVGYQLTGTGADPEGRCPNFQPSTFEVPQPEGTI